MVNFNLPTNNPNTQPTLISQVPLDRNVLAAAEGSVQNSAQVLNMNLQSLDQANREARRSALVANEAKAVADIAVANKDAALQEVSLNAMLKLASIDEARRAQEEEQLNRVYEIDTAVNFRTELEAFKIQARNNMNPDGSGYVENVQSFINDRLKLYTDNAPTEKAKLRVYELISQDKISSVSEGFDIEERARAEYRIGLANNAFNTVLNTVVTDPTRVSQARESIINIGQNLADAGMNPQAVDQLTKANLGRMYELQIGSVVNGESPEIAMELLLQDEVKAFVEPSRYSQLVNNTYNSVIQAQKAKQEVIESNMYKEAYMSNKIAKGMEGFDSAADNVANEILFSQIGDTSAITPDSIPQIASTVGTYFSKFNAGLGKQTKAILDSKILNSQNPFEVAAYSLAMSSLIDQDGRSIQAFDDLDSDAKVKARRVASLVSYGVPADIAVKQVDDTLKLQYQPGYQIQVREATKAKLYDKDGKSKAAQRIFGSWVPFFGGVDKYQKEYLNAEAEKIFELELARYKDADLAYESTEAKLKSKYRKTSINGDTKIMEAAPELYFEGEILDKFYSELDLVRQDISKQRDILPEDVEIRAIPNLTVSQGVDRKDYLLYNKKTGMILTDPKSGAFKRFTFTQDFNGVQEDFKMKRSELNNANKAVKAELDKWLAAASGNK